jgi:AcrR family transcriptional regulator
VSTSEKPRYHHGDLRAALLGAAMELLEEDDGGLSLRAVARRAGVSATAPYRHFADKEALESELAAQGFADLGRRLGAAAPRSASLEPTGLEPAASELAASQSAAPESAALELAASQSTAPEPTALESAAPEDFAQLAVSYVRFALDRPALFRLMFGTPCTTSEDARAVAAAELGGFVLAHVRQAFPQADAEALATASWSLVHGLAFLHLDGKFPSADAEEVEARVTAAITAILTLRPTA